MDTGRADWTEEERIEIDCGLHAEDYLNIAYEMYAKGSMTWDQYWFKAAETYTSLAGVLLSDPGRFLATIGGNIVDHAIGDMGILLGWQVGIFTLAGIGVAIKQRISRETTGFLGYSLVFFSVLLLVFYSERFSLFLLIGYTLLAIVGLSWNGFQTVRFGKQLLWAEYLPSSSLCGPSHGPMSSTVSTLIPVRRKR